MEKLDPYKKHGAEYAAGKNPALVDLGPARYFAVEGRGEPGGNEFTEKLGSLYNMAFTVKMASKFDGSDYAVSKLEGLWWTDAGGEDFMEVPREQWRWKLLIRIPNFITEDHRGKALQTLAKRGKGGLVEDVRILEITEGRCIQILHVGPYSDEPASIAKMRAFAEAQHFRYNGAHHEIYLGDPRRGDPAKLKTILRQPVAPIE